MATGKQVVRRMIEKGRLEAFTDAIIAIAATIMVLELAAPDEVSVAALLSQWSVLVAYIISFSMIYIVWLNHYRALKKVEAISVKVFFINGIWLFFLTLVPFATAWVGKHPDDTLPEALYVAVLFLWSLMYQILDNQLVKENPQIELDSTNGIKLRAAMYLGYLLAFVLSFIKPVLCMVVIIVVLVIITVHFLSIKKAVRK